MFPLNKTFQLFASCIPVKGISRALICDLSRSNFDFIPTVLVEILNNKNKYTIEQILKQYGEENKETLLEYFEFLVEKDYIFFCEKEELAFFPPLKQEWKSPYTITSAIIDYSTCNAAHLLEIITQLDQLACLNLQIRCFESWHDDVLIPALEELETSRIKNVEIIVPFEENIDNWIKAISSYKHVYSINVFGAPEEAIIAQGSLRTIYTTTSTITKSHCGKIHPSFFSVNVPTFTESQHHNTCLNRKISIDINGNIKNCPSMAQSFGHISSTNLEEVLDNPEFTKYWNIKKEDIHKCKQCEFRHICTDCRAYRENPEDLYSAPLKCGYNPVTCEWEDWSTNTLKQKAIAYYQLDHLNQ